MTNGSRLCFLLAPNLFSPVWAQSLHFNSVQFKLTSNYSVPAKLQAPVWVIFMFGGESREIDGQKPVPALRDIQPRTVHVKLHK